MISGGGDNFIKVWNVNEKECIQVYELFSRSNLLQKEKIKLLDINKIVLSRDNKSFVVGSLDNTIQIFSTYFDHYTKDGSPKVSRSPSTHVAVKYDSGEPSEVKYWKIQALEWKKKYEILAAQFEELQKTHNRLVASLKPSSSQL